MVNRTLRPAALPALPALQPHAASPAAVAQALDAVPITLDDLEGGAGGQLNIPASALTGAGVLKQESCPTGVIGDSYTGLMGRLNALQASEDPSGGGASTYTAQAGDNLSTIAKKTLGDANRWEEIWSLNRMQLPNPNRIYPGMVLRLPGGSTPAATPAAKPSASPSARKPASVNGAQLKAKNTLMGRLTNFLHNGYSGAVHQCFSYAWACVRKAGGASIDSARATTGARGRSISYLNTMINNAQLHVGDVIYVNRRPGADPSSTNLRYGPHWFVYLGNGEFADQYGQRNAAAMQNFVPGRVIDTIYHPF